MIKVYKCIAKNYGIFYPPAILQREQTILKEGKEEKLWQDALQHNQVCRSRSTNLSLKP